MQGSIEDFDKEVEARCAFIRSHAENLSTNMLCALDLALMGIPENVRKMPVKQLMEEFGGDIIKAAQHFEETETPKKGGSMSARKKRTPTQNQNMPQNIADVVKQTTSIGSLSKRTPQKRSTKL